MPRRAQGQLSKTFPKRLRSDKIGTEDNQADSDKKTAKNMKGKRDSS